MKKIIFVALSVTVNIFGAEQVYKDGVAIPVPRHIDLYASRYDFCNKKGHVVQTWNLNLVVTDKKNFLCGNLDLVRHPHKSQRFIIKHATAQVVGMLLAMQGSNTITKRELCDSLSDSYNLPPKEFADEVKDCEVVGD